MTNESISNKLSELFDLYKSGALTKEEYDRLKRQILSEGGEEYDEPEKKHDLEIKKSADKSIQGKKVRRIWILALTGIVSLVVVFLLFKNNLFTGKSGSNGQKVQTVKDIDGNVYKTVTIGAQIWMKENLKTTKYNDGTTIPLVTDNRAWEDLNTPAYCWYNNNETANKNTYGALYNWFAVNTNKLCPTGWHVSVNADWTTLSTCSGGESVASGKLKESGTAHWKSPDTGATNETGFTALPGGYLHHAGTFNSIGSDGYWWSATEFDGTHAWNSNLHFDISNVKMQNYLKQNGFSVRCLQDLGMPVNNTSVKNNPIVENRNAVWDEALATNIVLDELKKHRDWSFLHADDSISIKNMEHKILSVQKLVIGERELMLIVADSRMVDMCPPFCNGTLSFFEFENLKGWNLTQKALGISNPSSEVSEYKFYKMSDKSYGIRILEKFRPQRTFHSDRISLYTFNNNRLIQTLTKTYLQADTVYVIRFGQGIIGGCSYFNLEEKAKPENSDTILTRTVYAFNGINYEIFKGTITDPSLTSMSRFYDINSIEERNNNICPTCHGTGIQVCPLCGGTGVDNMGIECLCVRTYKMELAAGHTPSHPPMKWTCLSCGGTGKSRN